MTLSAEDLMLRLIRNEICGTEVTEDICFSVTPAVLRTLLNVSTSHDLAHLVSPALFRLGILRDGDELAEEFDDLEALAVFRYEQIKCELEFLSQAFEEEKIAFLPLKGAAIRQFYPEPWMRTSADIDILIHQEDLERVDRFLTAKCGYENVGDCGHHVSYYSARDVHVEIHYVLISPEDARVPEAAKVLSRVWEDAKPAAEGSCRYAMSNEMLLFYHLAHMAKHLLSAGCGMRFFLDQFILSERMETDRARLDALLREGRLDRFEQCVRAAAENWFGDGGADEDLRYFEDFILFSGIYGNNVGSAALGRKEGESRIHYLFRRLFPPYEHMIRWDPKVKGHRALLPLYHWERLFRALFRHGIKRNVSLVRSYAGASDEHVAAVNRVLSIAGLPRERKTGKEEKE